MYNIFATSTVHVVTNRISTSWPWYIIRGAGFLAAFLLIMLIISGIGQATGITYRFIEPVKAWALHRAMAIALCFAIVIHVSFLLIDHFVSFSWVQVLIPFESNYSNDTRFLGLAINSLTVTLGILSAYIVGIIVASSLGWIDSKKRLWRLLHYLGYVVIAFIFLHALYAGSDLKHGILRLGWIIAGIIVLLFIVARLWRSGTMNKDKSKP